MIRRLCALLLVVVTSASCIHITGYIDGRPVDLHVELQPRGTAAQTPLPTTPAPSITPTATVTRTPTPSATSTPAVSVPSPTHEITAIPTVAETTIPKPTPTQDLGSCWGIVNTATLNVRLNPGDRVIGQVHLGDTLALETQQTEAGVTWYQIYYTESQLGWVSGQFITLGAGANCPAPATAFGVWVGPGASRDELIAFGDRLQSRGIQSAATVWGERDTASILHERGWLVAWRAPIADCPDTSLSAVSSARAWLAKTLSNSVGVGYDYLITANECWWPSAVYLRDWIAEMVTISKAAGVKRLIPVVFNSGSPEFDWIPVLLPALLQLRAAGGCAGFNAYPVRVGVPLARYDDWTRYTTYRWEMLGLPDGLDICLTEFAASDGAQAADFADIAQFAQRVDGRVRFATAWYVTAPGLLNAWINANLTGQLARLAQSLGGA